MLLTAWGLVLATVGALATAAPASFKLVDGPAVPSSVGPRVVDGKLTLGGQPFLPRGFNMIGLLAPSWCKKGQGPLAAAHFGQAELDAAKAWNANTLRFQVSQRGLADPAVSTADRAAYLARVVDGVRLARQQGFVVIVSMQDQSNGCGAAHPLPSDQTLAAWDAIAPPLMGDPGVMFELFNEPNVPDTPEGWAQWAAGGAGPSTNLGATALGQQALVDHLRALGVPNILIADGAKKAARLGGLVPLTDQSHQLMYGIHPYYFNLGLPYWDQQYGSGTAYAPVIATEWFFPSDECGTVKPTLAKTFLPYLRSHNIGMLAHAFDVPGTTVTDDWTWSPTDCAGGMGGSGKLTKDYFAGQSDPDITIPGAVGELAAAAVGPSDVQLRWQPASGQVDHYLVLRDGMTVATTTEPSYDDTGLTASSTYSYQVQGVDAQGRAGPVSEGVPVTTPGQPDLQPPTAPAAVQVSDVSPSGVSLRWEASSDDNGVVEYQVKRDGSTVGHTTGLTFSDTTVDQGVTYDYTVVALDAAGNVSASSNNVVVSVPTPDLSPPGAPTGLLATWSASNGSSLTWDADHNDTGVAGYLVDRDGTTIGSPTSTTFTDTAPLSPGDHTYAVRAVDAVGNVSASSDSAVVHVPTPDTSPPGAPAGLAVTWWAVTGSTLTWDADTDDDTGVTGYLVDRDGTTIGSPTSTMFMDTAPLSPGNHTYTVRAVDAAGNVSASSSPAGVMVPAPPDTRAPSVPTRVSAAVQAPTRSRVTWAASSDDTGVTGYRVTRDGTRIATVAATSFVDSAMPAGAKHVYRVAAVDAAGNASAASAAATVTAPAAASTGLTGKYYDTAAFGTLKVTRVDPTIDFTWGTGAPATGMGADTFSVRWTGNIIPASAETYTFYLQSDDGARLWVNGRLLVDDWALHSLREKKATIALAPTQAYSIRVDFRENTGKAAVRLAWSTPTIAKADIPTTQLLSK